jgi:hypothetical protein
MSAQASIETARPVQPVRFFIVTIGRTGSTRLRLLLDSHPQVCCHGELYGSNLATLVTAGSPLHAELLAERSADPAGFLARRAFATGSAQAVGLKILRSQLMQWPGLLEALRSDPGVRVIHLVRKNGLKRFLSEYFVGTVTRKHLLLPGEAPPEFEPVDLPIELLLGDLHRVAEQSAEIRSLFAGHPFHELAYEDSLEDNGSVLQGVQAFLGLLPAPLSSPIRKVLPDDPKRLVANYAELARALAGTPHEWMVES